MRTRLPWVAVVATGCALGGTEVSTADTRYTPSDTGEGCATVYEGPVVIEAASVTCDDAEQATWRVSTVGWTRTGRVNAMQTGVPLPWDDEHDLQSVAWDPCGSSDELERTLRTAADPFTVVEDASTVFTCAELGDPSTMTYAVRVYDVQGNLADCLAWGHDPEDFTAGRYSDVCVSCPSDPEELTMCVVGRRAR